MHNTCKRIHAHRKREKDMNTQHQTIENEIDDQKKEMEK